MATPMTPPGPLPLAPPHVLAVDDDALILELYATVLADEGYLVSTHHWSGHDIRPLLAHRPDLILMDYRAATWDDGWTVLTDLRLARETAAVPIVLCTGAVSHVEETWDHLDQLEVTVVPKPFELDQLVATVGRCLDGRADMGRLVPPALAARPTRRSWGWLPLGSLTRQDDVPPVVGG